MRSGKVYLFKGEKYVRWDIAQDKLDFEALIADEWVSAVAPNTRLADVVSSTGSFGEGIDAAVNWGNGKAYLFKGNKYVRWDIAQDKLDFEALIADEWVSAVVPNTRLADVVSSTGSFGEGIDAAVNWGNGKAYLFKGNKYVRWDIAQDKLDFEALIADKWVSAVAPNTRLADVVSSTGSFGEGIDAAVNWGNGKAYLFKGNKYVRWDIAQDKLDFEALIADEWVSAVAPNTRLADVVSSTGSFGEGIDAAANWAAPFGFPAGAQQIVTSQGTFRRFPPPATRVNNAERPLFSTDAARMVFYTGPGSGAGNQRIHPVVARPLSALMGALIAEGVGLDDESMKQARVTSAFRPPTAAEGAAYLAALRKTITGNPQIFAPRTFPAQLEAMAQSELGFTGSPAHNAFRDAVAAAPDWNAQLAQQLVSITANFKAPRGGSTHHSGVVVDIDFPFAPSPTDVKFHNTQRERNADALRAAAGVWLNANAPLYGFDSFNTASEIWHQEWRQWQGTDADPARQVP